MTRRRAAAPQAKSVSYLVSLLSDDQGATVARTPWLLAEQGLWAAARDQSVDDEKDDCADNGADEARALSGFVPVHEMADPARNDRARDSEQYGDQASPRITARSQQLGDGAGDPSNDD